MGEGFAGLCQQARPLGLRGREGISLGISGGRSCRWRGRFPWLPCLWLWRRLRLRPYRLPLPFAYVSRGVEGNGSGGRQADWSFWNRAVRSM